MPTIISSTHLRNFLRWALLTMSALVLLVFLGLAYVSFVGIEFDASSLRETIAKMLSDNIGRKVLFDGPMQIEISARPRLRAGGLHIANVEGFEGGEFAKLGEARLALDLRSLFRGRMQVQELAGKDVRIRLQKHADGSNNWLFHLPKSQPGKESASQEVSVVGIDRVLVLLDIKRVSLEDLDVEYIDATAKSRFFDLRSLTAQLPAGQPFTLTLDGTLEKEFPYRLDFTGGSIADLAQSGKPWPIDLSLNFLSSKLALKGSVSGATGQISFNLNTENLFEFERLLQTKLPDVGNADIAGRVTFSPGKIGLDGLAGVMGKTTLNGALDFDYVGSKPHIKGALTAPTLDLRPFMTDKPDKQAEPPKSLAEVYREIANATFDLRELNSADADITLQVERWLNLPGDVHDASLQVKIENGRLDVPVQATIAGVKLSGNANTDAALTPARFHLELGTKDSNLGGLAELLVGAKGIKGQLGLFNVRIAASGDRGSELLKSLDVRIGLERGQLTYGNEAGSRPVGFELKKLVVALPPGKPLTGSANGSLLGQPLTISLRGGALEPMMQKEISPIDFSIQSGSVHAHVGGMLQAQDEKHGPEIMFDLSAPHASEVAGWLGLKPGADAAISLAGKAVIRSHEWRLADLSLQLGRSTFATELLRTEVKGKPLIKMRLSADRIDLDQLQSLRPESEKKESTTSLLDIPILPQGIDLTDSDIEVEIKQFAGGGPLEVRDLSYNGHIREGYMGVSPFSANVGGTVFNGAISLDLRGKEASATLSLAADSVEAGNLMGKLGLVHNLDARVRKLQVDLFLHSGNLGRMIADSTLKVNFEGGHLTLQDKNTGGQMRINLDVGTLSADAGAPVLLDMKGTLDDIPVSIYIETAPTVDLINPSRHVPFKLKAKTVETTIHLKGNIARPLTHADIEMALDMHGPRFDSLNRLVRTSLPPWGPWSVAGQFRMSARGYEIAALKLQVSDSELAGQGKLETTATPPRLDISLAAPKIQIDDFKFGDWTLAPKDPNAKPAKNKTPMTTEEMRKKAVASSNEAQHLLSREVLQRQDVYLTVRVDKVLSGKDTLGSGKFDAKLEKGRANIGPLQVNIPGGSAKFSLDYEPGEKDVEVNVQTEVDHFDYGVLARRFKPDTDMQGSFSLNVDVKGRATYLSEVLQKGNGNINFAIWPVNMKSGVFDIWAVDLLVALLPAVDSSKASKVNCAIGRFELTNGKLADKTFLVDTSRMRVTGKGSADFTDEKITLQMRPQAKTPQFLSLATPIEVDGTFENFHIGVSASEVVGTIGRFVTSFIWVPLQMLFDKDVPEDGRDVCSKVEFK